jgi:SNF2 family DNA or RNA helicase
MARIWREGQKREVKIYRFLCKGGIEEKIFQRQMAKRGLSDSVVDGENENERDAEIGGSGGKGEGEGKSGGMMRFSKEEVSLMKARR